MGTTSGEGRARPPVSQEDIDRAVEYAQAYYGDPQLLDVIGPLLRHRPEVFHGYITLRQAAFNTGPGAALTTREKELIILAIEIATRKTNPPPTGHTRRAIAAGATVTEIAEVVSLCIMIAGMLTYHESGVHVLRLAEELAAERERNPAEVKRR
jgi:alkylhydroperoxidase/carboxymuconolactone decarboxylase family protein YurZ